MVIEKLHGLSATAISLNDRFTVLASVAPVDRPVAPAPQPQLLKKPFNPVLKAGVNLRNRALAQEIAWRLERQSKIQALRQRLGYRQNNFRRYGSEGNLSNWRSKSFNNLNNNKNYKKWGSRNNLSRAASFSNLSQFSYNRPHYQRNRGMRRHNSFYQQIPPRYRYLFPNRYNFQWNYGFRIPYFRFRNQNNNRGRRGVGRGGFNRGQKQNRQNVPTKEELDHQLDKYMANSKSALDKELDEYMSNAMELE